MSVRVGLSVVEGRVRRDRIRIRDDARPTRLC